MTPPLPITPSFGGAARALGPGRVEIMARVTPKAGRDAVDGIGFGADGRAHVKLRVAAAPAKGAANAAARKLLAKALGVAQSDARLVAGSAARLKRFEVACSLETAEARLAAAIG